MVLPFQQITQRFAIALVAVLSSTSMAIAVEPQDTKARLLTDIAFQYADLGKSDRAIEVLEQGLRLTRAMSSKCFQANPLARTAGSYFLLGQDALAKQLLAEAVQTAKKQDATGCSSSATSPTESLSNRAGEYAEAGHLEFAIDLSSQLGDPILMAELAGYLEAAGQSERAAKILDQAIVLAMASPQFPSPLLLIAMAESLRAAEHPTLVPRLLQRSLESISAKPSSQSPAELQIHSMLGIARSFAGIQSNSQALAVLGRAMSKVQTRPNAEKVQYQVEAASQYKALGQPRQATEILAAALANAQNLPKDKSLNRESALASVAEAYAKLGDFEQALKIARSAGKVQGRIFGYERIAVAYAIAGKSDEAARLAQLGGNRNNTLIEIVRYYLTQKQPDQALKFVQTHQVKGIADEVAQGYLKAGQPEQALKIVQNSQPKNQPKNQEKPKNQEMEWVFPEVARGFAQQKQFNSALEVAQSINNKTYKIQALVAIAEGYSNIDTAKPEGVSGLMTHFGNWVQETFGDSDREQAVKALDQALELARSL